MYYTEGFYFIWPTSSPVTRQTNLKQIKVSAANNSNQSRPVPDQPVHQVRSDPARWVEDHHRHPPAIPDTTGNYPLHRIGVGNLAINIPRFIMLTMDSES